MLLPRLLSRRPSARVVRDEWLEALELNGYRPKTIDGYRRTTDRFLDLWPKLAMSRITEEHIIGFIEAAPLPSRMTRRAAFHNWFGWAFRTKHVTFNPMNHVPAYKQPPQEPVQTFNDDERVKLCALPEPDGTLMALLLGSGLRKSEARLLTVQRIDLQHGELHIIEGAKGGHARVGIIEVELVARLGDFIGAEGLGPADHLWYCHPGGTKRRDRSRAISDGAMFNWWTRCIEASGVPYRNMHVTRHTYATELRRLGLDMDDVGFLLGHRDTKTTKQVYVHTGIFDVKPRLKEKRELAAAREAVAA